MYGQLRNVSEGLTKQIESHRTRSVIRNCSHAVYFECILSAFYSLCQQLLLLLLLLVVVVVVVVVCVRACVRECVRALFFSFPFFVLFPPPPTLPLSLPPFPSFLLSSYILFRAGRGRGDNSKINFVTSDQPTLSSPLLPRPPPPHPPSPLPPPHPLRPLRPPLRPPPPPAHPTPTPRAHP